MNAESRTYWQMPNEIQQRVKSLSDRRINTLLDQIVGISVNWFRRGSTLSKQQMITLHSHIDSWTELNFWGNNNLEARARLLRRRRRIPCNSAFEIMLLAAYTQTYRSILDVVEPLYVEVFKIKFREFTGNDFIGALGWDINNTILPLGVTMAEITFIEASHRARRMAKVINGTISDGNRNVLVDTQFVRREISTARNQLLKESATGNWIGILDRIMCWIIGYSIIAVCKFVPTGRYIFRSVGDKESTSICRRLNGKMFLNSRARLGRNTPPVVLRQFHHCRSYVEFI